MTGPKCIALVVFWGLGLLSAVARAEPDYVVGVEGVGYYPHYSFENDEYVGFGRELFDAFAADQNVVFDFRPLPIKRLLLQLGQGRVALKYPDNPDWNVVEKNGFNLAYSRSIVKVLDGSLVRPERLGRPTNHVRTLGTIRDFTLRPYYGLIANLHIDVLPFNSVERLLRRTLRGKLDAIYLSVDVARYQLRGIEGGADGLVFDPGLPHEVTYYTLSSIHHPDLVRRFDQWLVRNVDWVDELKRKYSLGEYGTLP